jgi:hypothetical protein
MATIQELESFNLSDAVSFHKELNPRLWEDEKLDSEVRDQLLLIAEDFVEYLGINNLNVQDVTISGSNAAYSYTPHSDIDLHILVDFNDLPNNEVYQELFTAKKTLYNDAHDITVHGIPVELYVQDTNNPVQSLGEYSIVHDKWIRIPKRRKANFDQTATKLKYEKLGDLIELALKTKNIKKVNDTIALVRRYRKSGLDKTGEFGPENLAFKAVRKQGLIKQLYDLKSQLHGERLSIEEYATEDYDPNGPPPGPEFKPTMPKGTVRVDVSDVYDWYKLGQHISNMKGLGKHDFGKGPPSTILSFGDEDLEHQYIQALGKTGLTTTDIDPIDPNQPKGMKKQKTDPTFNVAEMQLTELSDNPYRYVLTSETPEKLSYRFQTDFGLTYDVMIKNTKMMQVHFVLQGNQPDERKSGVESTGDSFRILSTVGNILLDAVEKLHPMFIVIMGKTDELSRMKLYRALARRLTKIIPEFQITHEAPWKEYTIIYLRHKDFSKTMDVVSESEDKKAAVLKIQKHLNKKYGANLDLDGKLGPLTLQSINKFMPRAKTGLADEPNKTTAVQGKKVKVDEEITELQVYKNPSPKQLYRLTQRSAHKHMRGIHHNGVTYWWDGKDAIHKQGSDYLSIPYDYQQRMEAAIDSISDNYRVGGDDGVPQNLIQKYDIENELAYEDIKQNIAETDPLLEFRFQEIVHTNPTVATLKSLAKNNKYGAARFTITQDGTLKAGDSEKFTHQDISPDYKNVVVRGYVTHASGNDYIFKGSGPYDGNYTIDHPMFRKFERAGLINGNKDQMSVTEEQLNETTNESQLINHISKKAAAIIFKMLRKKESLIADMFGPNEKRNKLELYGITAEQLGIPYINDPVLRKVLSLVRFSVVNYTLNNNPNTLASYDIESHDIEVYYPALKRASAEYGLTLEEMLAKKIAHELLHAVDNLKSGGKAIEITGDYLARPHEINARFQEALMDIAITIDRTKRKGKKVSNKSLPKFIDQILARHVISQVLPKSGSRYKHLVSRAYKFFDAELNNPKKETPLGITKRAMNFILGKPTSEITETKTSVSDIGEKIKNSLGLQQFYVFERGDTIEVSSLIVGKENQGKGLGSKAMQQLIDYADDNNKRITLTPGSKDKTHGTTSRARLVQFYKSLGFKESKGRNLDYAIGAGKMYRDPNSNVSHTVTNEASGYIPSAKEKNDPRFKTALTVDVRPSSIKDNAAKLGLGNIKRTGVPQTANPNGKPRTK